MRVFSTANEYTVITRLRDGRRYTALDRDGKTCLLVLEKQTREAKRLALILQDWIQIQEFSDLHEIFAYKGGIAVVFTHHTGGKPLQAQIEDMQYTQRALILRAIFALILRQELPVEILCGTFDPENLRIYDSGNVELLYDLPRRDSSALRRTVKLVCGTCDAPEIDALYTKIADNAYSARLELYKTAVRAADKLASYVPPPVSRKKSMREIKEWAESVFKVIMARAVTVIAAAALIAGYIAAGLFFYHSVIAPARVDNGIRSIGSVVIDDGG